jgi:hypothetical protein
MGMFELPKWAHPDLQQGRERPGGLEVDWDNPLTKNLIAFMVPMAGGSFDLVSQRYFSRHNNFSSRPDMGRMSRFCTGGSNVEVLASDGLWAASAGITAGYVARYDGSVGNDDSFVDFRNDANSWRLKLTTNTATSAFRVFAKNGGSRCLNYSGGPDPADNKAHRVIASIGNSSRLRLAVDDFGVQDTSSSGGSPLAADDFKLGSDGGGGAARGAIYCAYAFNRQLSEAEMVALNANPFALLKPRFPLAFLTPDDVSGITAALATTLGTLTLNAAANADIGSTADITLGALTLDAVTGIEVDSTLDTTLGALTLSGTTGVDIDATADISLSAVTLSADGTVVTGISASLDTTLDSLILDADAATTVDGTLSITLADLGLTAVGVITGTGIIEYSGIVFKAALGSAPAFKAQFTNPPAFKARLK